MGQKDETPTGGGGIKNQWYVILLMITLLESSLITRSLLIHACLCFLLYSLLYHFVLENF